MTAYGSVEAAVSAMREGAYDFVEKPLKRVTHRQERAQGGRAAALVAENKSLKDEIKLLTRREIVGSSPALAARGRRGDAGRAEPGHGARARRERHGQGAPRALHPRAQRARREARSSPSTAPRSPRRSSRASCSGTSGARSPARSAEEGRPLREGRGRHALPRRDRRALARGAGEAAPRAAGGGVRAARRQHGPQRTCASSPRPTAICSPR